MLSAADMKCREVRLDSDDEGEAVVEEHHHAHDSESEGEVVVEEYQAHDSECEGEVVVEEYHAQEASQSASNAEYDGYCEDDYQEEYY